MLDDGDASAMAPGSMIHTPLMPSASRFCPGDDCSGVPLAFWKFDDCNAQSTELADTAFTSPITHPAFRAVGVACATGIDGEAVQIARDDDIVYAPDQPDFLFNKGLTIAAWINPDNVNGTQSLVRKRLDGSSAFVLAIDGRRLTFVFRLTNGKTVSVSAAVKAGRFTHVAATYDGKDALLYLDGAVAAKAHAMGTIAPGVGPIFIGNDANGRKFKGVIDNVWLNTLAAPADTITGLTCVRKPPIATITPGATPPQVAGATVSFDLSVTNPSGPACPIDTFEIFPEISSPLSSSDFSSQVTAGPGETAHATVNVKSSRMASAGSYPVAYGIFSAGATKFVSNLVTATYVVGTGPVACDGLPPQSPLITGTPFGPTGIGGVFSYAAPGLNVPVVTPVTSPTDGSLQALQVTADPGTTTDLMNNFSGFGLGFGNPPCLDASAFTGVSFTVTGDLGTCGLALSLVPSQNNSVAFGTVGVCTAARCFGPFSGPVTTGTTIVHFSDMSGGTPLATLDPTALNDISWNLTAPTDGVTAPCKASFTVSDVSFVAN